MSEPYYDFDRCSLDESDDDAISLDDWKPSIKKKEIIQSSWRKEQIGNNFNQHPKRDDFKKIKMHLKSKVADAEIMDVFGITCETLMAIKQNRYSPINGISMDNLSKIYKEFDTIESNINKLNQAIKYLSKILFVDETSLKEFTDYCNNTKTRKLKEIVDSDADEDMDEFMDDL
jgi:hypothetical protein